MAKLNWYKGNIHTHTTESDGDAEPEKVTAWYRRHGYDFLVLSDHNHLTMLDYGQGKRRYKRPLMIPGEEVSVRIEEGGKAIHVNGIGISRVVEPIDAGGVVETLQANVNAILDAGGIASINHPNFSWAFNHEEISQLTGASLLEIFNGHPLVNVYGTLDKPGYEEIWDNVLTSGNVIFGVATDDSHNYKEFSLEHSNPGRGWIVVRAEELSQESIVEAMTTGNLYASTGIVLEALDITSEGVFLDVQPFRDQLYTIRFLGSGGRVLQESVDTEATYEFQGDEGYVRAVVLGSSGGKAWTQPVFI